MRCARVALLVASAALLASCGGPKLQERSTPDMTKLLPSTLEAERPREGEPRVATVRVWTDAGVRANPRWKEDLNDQIDYANQLLTPLLGARLTVESWHDWDRAGEPHQALTQLAEVDRGDRVTWVIGYIAAGDTATKAMPELGFAEPLGKHVVVRGWAEKPEADALAGSLPDLGEAERNELLGAHRRHKQTVVLLHALASTLGAIAETDPAWLQHPLYSAKQTGFSERNRELMTLALEDRLTGGTDQTSAKKLLESIEKSEWGGWIGPDREQVVARLRNVLDAARAGQTAADVPGGAYDQFNRIRELARRGQPKDALIELENLLTAYPGNAAMHQLRCDIMLGSPGVADKTTRAACARASELAPGDPGPHLAVGEALARTGDLKAARLELVQAEGKIRNLHTGQGAAWKKVIGIYQSMGSLTWTEQAIAQGKLEQDPAAAQIAQTRARYGVPRGGKVAADQEGALVAAVRKSLDLVYASKYGEAEREIGAAEKKWPNAAGLAGARCDLALRMGQYDAARAACGRALAADPNASWALYLSGVIALRDASGTRGGIEKLKRAIAVDPELGQAWRTLAKAYARENDKAALDQLAKDYQAKFGQTLPR